MDSLTFQNNFTCFVTPQWQAKTCSAGEIALLRKRHSPGGGGLCGGWSGRGRLGTERDLLGERRWHSPPRSSSCFRSARAVSSGEITAKVYQILDRKGTKSGRLLSYCFAPPNVSHPKNHLPVCQMFTSLSPFPTFISIATDKKAARV